MKTKTTIYPINIDDYSKGDYITQTTCEEVIGKASKDLTKYQFGLMRLRNEVVNVNRVNCCFRFHCFLLLCKKVAKPRSAPPCPALAPSRPGLFFIQNINNTFSFFSFIDPANMIVFILIPNVNRIIIR